MERLRRLLYEEGRVAIALSVRWKYWQRSLSITHAWWLSLHTVFSHVATDGWPGGC